MKNSTYLIGKIIVGVSIIVSAVILGLLLAGAISDGTYHIARAIDMLH